MQRRNGAKDVGFEKRPMLVYRSEADLAPFRLAKLIAKVQKICPSVTHIEVRNYFFIALQPDSQLETADKTRLSELLSAEELTPSNLHNSNQQIWILPRLGTISSWSSKATDITHNCGFTAIKRIEHGTAYQLSGGNDLSISEMNDIGEAIADRMTESVFTTFPSSGLFEFPPPRPGKRIKMTELGQAALVEANQVLALALSPKEIEYLYQSYLELGRDPTETELMMFAQANSEHCRHKIFNATWTIDGEEKPSSLFSMIKQTYANQSEGVLVAYKDNGAVLNGYTAPRWIIDSKTHHYYHNEEAINLVIKVETHNHPTAISPFPGAATGAGGEIRDEAATGRGAHPKAGLTGFSVSPLHIPDFKQPWEINLGKPDHIASSFEIMLDGPIGAASFNNEFGRPNLCGYFRTFGMELTSSQGVVARGYHKPIMIAGGLGNIRTAQVEKKSVKSGDKLVVLGGPAMLIGMGGGSASSVFTGSSEKTLDFASVQRSNPEMQRRTQEVINACWALGEANPIVSIHDVGAGGLANALPELVVADSKGAKLHLRDIPSVDSRMTPLEIWCNEAQERYVLAIRPEDLPCFSKLAERERCPYAVVGEVSDTSVLMLYDKKFDNYPVNLPMNVLFGNLPPLHLSAKTAIVSHPDFDTSQLDLTDAIERILHFPSVASKKFLITIGDRSVGGLVARDQMVGPWQTPVSDLAVTASSFQAYSGEAMAMGERAPIACLDPEAAARMALGEAITNIAAADIGDISQIKISANWMAAIGYSGEDAALYKAVKALALEMCPALGICIPVGKDSLSMRVVWEESSEKQAVVSPQSLIISAFAPVIDVRKTLTPVLNTDVGATVLILIDLGQGANRLGGSALAQVFGKMGACPPDIDDPKRLVNFFDAIQQLNQTGYLLAYHDRSDGGLFTTIAEMAFASHTGITLKLDELGETIFGSLFSEELGAVVQVETRHLSAVLAILSEFELSQYVHLMGELNQEDQLIIQQKGKKLYAKERWKLEQAWAETSFRMQALRDNPACAQQEFNIISDVKDPGLQTKLTFALEENIAAPYIKRNLKPKVAILREQGVNGQMEMAAAFTKAGFTAVDVCMTDLLSGGKNLMDFHGLTACGGFSYGDVLGAGQGWAKTILFNSRLKEMFAAFFERSHTFTLGACNGCQMLSHLKTLIPGAEDWPQFLLNLSEQYEARFSLVEIQPSPSLFFTDMIGSRIPIAIAHGEGRADFTNAEQKNNLKTENLVCLRYIDHYGEITERYPFNPNGSAEGMTGFTSRDGRATILMPHPERVFRTVQCSWHPDEWGKDSPWLRMFENARSWVG